MKYKNFTIIFTFQYKVTLYWICLKQIKQIKQIVIHDNVTVNLCVNQTVHFCHIYFIIDL